MNKLKLILIISLIIFHLGWLYVEHIPVNIYEDNFKETITQARPIVITKEKVLTMTKVPLSSNKVLYKNQTID